MNISIEGSNCRSYEARFDVASSYVRKKAADRTYRQTVAGHAPPPVPQPVTRKEYDTTAEAVCAVIGGGHDFRRNISIGMTRGCVPGSDIACGAHNRVQFAAFNHGPTARPHSCNKNGWQIPHPHSQRWCNPNCVSNGAAKC